MLFSISVYKPLFFALVSGLFQGKQIQPECPVGSKTPHGFLVSAASGLRLSKHQFHNGHLLISGHVSVKVALGVLVMALRTVGSFVV